MNTRTNKDSDWLTVGFGDIIDVKKILSDVMERFKDYWRSEVPEWDYEISEDDGEEYLVSISCGLTHKVCIVRQSIIIEDPDFAKQSYGKLSVWKRLLIEIATTGTVKLYQDTINLYRKGLADNFGVPFEKNPLTISEAYQQNAPTKIKTVQFAGGKKGIDDLVSEYAFHGNSQGDDSVSNDVATYNLSQGWMSYNFKDIPMEQTAINKEVKRRKKQNQDYIQKCKDDGTYGQELPPHTFHLVPMPQFDEIKEPQ